MTFMNDAIQLSNVERMEVEQHAASRTDVRKMRGESD